MKTKGKKDENKIVRSSTLTQPVLVSGTGINARPISDMNFGVTEQQQPAQQTQKFQGFGADDPRGWQQRQQHLNSLGVDTTGWQRQDIMRGVKKP